MRRTLVLSAFGALVLCGLAHPVSAQRPDTLRNTPELARGQQPQGPTILPLTHEDVVQRIRESGFTRAQVRARLQQMNQAPGIADRYFDVMTRGARVPRGDVPLNVRRALSLVGIDMRPRIVGDSLLADSARIDSLRADSLFRRDSLSTEDLPVFGRDLFLGAGGVFDPIAFGPVDSDYRLGPGDQVILTLTGDVELGHNLEISREGLMVVPDVGQVFVNGLTLDQLRDQLFGLLGNVYSGVRRGPEATTQFQVSLGALRTNQVFVMGEVDRPRSYQLGAGATVMHSLYQAGGPSDNGTFREVKVTRGGETVRTVDIYDYLLRGDNRNDVRLEQGDIVFVPVVGTQVTIEGAVKRPMKYEVKEGEGLRDLIEFAGGFQADAIVRRVQIDRIVPPSERRPGVDRVLEDISVEELMADDGRPIPLQDGDAVKVFAVGDERRNRIAIVGEVRRPGVYQYTNGMTLWDLIDQAEGLDDRAYTPRANIFRLNESTGRRRAIPITLTSEADGEATRDLALADRDSVVVYSREVLSNPRSVVIDGFVKDPGEYDLAEGMTLQDLILASGGFVDGALVSEAEVARRPDSRVRSDTVARVITVALQNGSTSAELAGDRDVPSWMPSPDDFELQHGDRVFVRRAAGFDSLRTVVVTGEVLHPGPYVLDSRLTRLSDLVGRAGGLTNEAYASGFQLHRETDGVCIDCLEDPTEVGNDDGEERRSGDRPQVQTTVRQLVAADLVDAMENPNSGVDLALEDGDSLHVPKFDPTVLVQGAVAFETRVQFVPDKGLDYYIEQAGGYLDAANESGVSVTYQNGRRAVVSKVLMFRSSPHPGPGSTIFVPEKGPAEQGFNLRGFLSSTVGLLSTIATAVVLIDRLGK